MKVIAPKLQCAREVREGKSEVDEADGNSEDDSSSKKYMDVEKMMSNNTIVIAAALWWSNGPTFAIWVEIKGSISDALGFSSQCMTPTVESVRT